MLTRNRRYRPLGNLTWLRIQATGAVFVTALGSCGSPQAAQRPEAATTPVESDRTATSPAKPARSVAPPTTPTPLFDGKTLQGWAVIDEADFEAHGKVFVKDGMIVLGSGSPMTGVRWAGTFPTEGYEVTLEAMRIEGGDFFCGMTFPVGDSPLTLIVGGWGGCIVGLSNVDGFHAAENETTTAMTFENGRWYRIQLRVTASSIEAWIDDQQLIDLARGGQDFSIWIEQEPAKPFGVATYYTKAALRNIVLQAAR
jgi:hypothetical protein